METLSEMELKILIERRKKTVEELAAEFGLTSQSIIEILNEANRKIAKDNARPFPADEIVKPSGDIMQ